MAVASGLCTSDSHAAVRKEKRTSSSAVHSESLPNEIINNRNAQALRKHHRTEAHCSRKAAIYYMSNEDENENRKEDYGEVDTAREIVPFDLAFQLEPNLVLAES